MYGVSGPNNNSSSFQQNQDSQSNEQSRRNHTLPPRPPVSVDSYRPSYNGGGNGPNTRPMNSSNNNNNQYFNSYGAQQGYSQGSYGQQQQQQRPPPQNPPYWDQQQQQHGQYQQQNQQGYQQGYQQQQQPYQQQEQQYYGSRFQQADYRQRWDLSSANYEPQGGRGNGYAPLEGGGVAVPRPLPRNDHHNQYDTHGPGGQTIPTGPRNDLFHSQNYSYNNDSGGSQATIRRKEKRKHKKDRKRGERIPEQRQQQQQQQHHDTQPSDEPGARKSKGASVLPVPKPTEDYLALTESQLPEDYDSKKLLILDLNDTLVSRGSPNTSGARAVRPRPFLAPFLDYIFKHFSVMVWSSARPQNVRNMVSGSFPRRHEKALVALWSRENFGLKPEHYNAKIITYKNLEMVWDKIPHPQAEEGKSWDQTNTILVDDSVVKACAQPYNHLLIDVWDNPGKQQDDRTLLDVVGYLEKVVRGAGNVSQAMRDSAYTPGTGKWEQFIPVEALGKKKLELNEEEIVSKPVEEVVEVEKDNGSVETTVETVAVENEDVGSEEDNAEGGIKLSM